MKPTVIVYCGEDAAAAKAAAAPYKDGTRNVIMASAESFKSAETPCDMIVFARDVPQARREKIAAGHGVKLPERKRKTREAA